MLHADKREEGLVRDITLIRHGLMCVGGGAQRCPQKCILNDATHAPLDMA